MLTLRAVSNTFETPTGVVAPLRSVSLDLAEGARVAVVGARGAGKSTLAAVAAALRAPSSGTVLFDGQDLAMLDADALAGVRRRDIGVIAADPLLCETMTVLENICVPLSGTAADREARDQGRALLAALSLDHAQDAWPSQLAPLEQRLVSVVRAFVRGPRLVVADTMGRGLASGQARTLTDVVVRLQQRFGAALLMLCDHPSEAGGCETRYALEDGHLSVERRT